MAKFFFSGNLMKTINSEMKNFNEFQIQDSGSKAYYNQIAHDQ